MSLLLALTAGGGPTNYSITANAGSYTCTGFAATLLRSRVLVSAAGAYSYSGVTAGVARSRVLSGAAGAYTYAGIAASIARSRVIASAAGAYTYTGVTATLAKGRTLAGSAGAYSYSGVAATINRSTVITALAGVYNYTGNAATLSHDTPAGASGKSGVSRMWLIEYYTREYAKKEEALAVERKGLTAVAQRRARKAAAITRDAEIEQQVVKAERDLEVLTQGIKDTRAAQQFTYNLIQQARMQPEPEFDFMRVANEYRKRIQRDDDELLLLSMIL